MLRKSPMLACPRCRDELPGKFIGNTALQINSTGSHAGLALEEKRTHGCGLYRFVQISIIQHDQRALATKLQGNGFEVPSRQLGDMRPHAGEPQKVILFTFLWVVSTSPISKGGCLLRR